MSSTGKTFTRFLYYVYTLFLAAGVVSIIRIITLQTSKDRVTAEDIYRQQVLMPSRGSILSYDGKPLAVSIPVYELRWDSRAMSQDTLDKYIDSLSLRLAGMFKDKSAAAYKRDMLNARRDNNRYYRIGNRDVDYGELETIKDFPLFRLGQFKGGLIADMENQRVNPYGKLADRTIGYLNADGGGTGVEYTYDYRLRGEKGIQTVHRTLGDQWIPVNGAEARPAVDGCDIRTTIDVRIQEAAETELRRQLAMSDVFEGGTAVVMDVKTGAVR